MLGAEIGVTDLAELAASMQLAGTESARIRDSLAAKAAPLRARQLAEAEGRAASATERMSPPVVLLADGMPAKAAAQLISALRGQAYEIFFQDPATDVTRAPALAAALSADSACHRRRDCQFCGFRYVHPERVGATPEDAMSQIEAAPPGVDPAVPSPARL